MSEVPREEETRLREARLRAFGVLAGTVLLGVAAFGLYRFFVAPDLPPGGCKVSSDCPVAGQECLQAPTGAYCTHRCDRDEDCDPGMHCDVPPWEKEQDPRTVCIHDTKVGGQH